MEFEGMTFEDQYRDDSDADTKFKVGLRIIKVHSFLACAISPELKRIIQENGTEQSIDMAGFNYDTVQNFKKFMYLQTCDFNFSTIPDLLRLAKMFKVETLTTRCGAELIKQINFINALETLVLLDKYKLQNLRQAAIQYIFKYRRPILIINRGQREQFQKKNPVLAAELYFHIISKEIMDEP